VPVAPGKALAPDQELLPVVRRQDADLGEARNAAAPFSDTRREKEGNAKPELKVCGQKLLVKKNMDQQICNIGRMGELGKKNSSAIRRKKSSDYERGESEDATE